MSFVGYKAKIEYGDTVLINVGRGRNPILQIQVESGKVHQTAYGALKHNDLVGKRYGSIVNCSKGWVYALHPTPELWTISLPHRTQILYTTDISQVLFELMVKPGSVVVECGTGSGSMAHSIIRSIAPNGHLHTFDFHEDRVKMAADEFKAHNVSHLVTIKQRDVCSEGFGLEDTADAVFLDLPSPWLALPHAKTAMKKSGGRLCSFSPCIEQVQRTCEVLRQLGFIDVEMKECLQVPLETRTISLPLPDFGGKPESVAKNDSLSGRFVNLEDETATSNSVKKLVLSESEILDELEDEKTEKEQREVEEEKEELDGDTVDNSEPTPKRARLSHKTESKNETRTAKANKPSFLVRTVTSPSEIPGHTGFLTFATLQSINGNDNFVSDGKNTTTELEKD